MPTAVEACSRCGHEEAKIIDQHAYVNSASPWTHQQMGASTPAGEVPTLDPATFRSVFGRHPAGVAVVAADVGGRPFGVTVSSVISVSAQPAMLALSLDAASRGWQVLRSVSTVTVNFLAADQVDLSVRFARRGIDRFDQTTWSVLTTGEPVLDGVTAWIRAEIVQSVAAGSSRLLVLRALLAHQDPSLSPLVYCERRYHRLTVLDRRAHE